MRIESLRRIGGVLLSGFLAVGLVASQTLAHDFKAGSLTIGHPWARATPPGAKVAGGYLTIENSSAEPDRLVAATVEIAGRAEIHEMAVVDGVMKMRPLDNGVEIPAGGSVELKPGGYHLMLMDLKQPLKQGEGFSGTLTFEKAGTVDVTYDIESIGATSPDEE
jgi:periplasmic copper chaperone A